MIGISWSDVGCGHVLSWAASNRQTYPLDLFPASFS